MTDPLVKPSLLQNHADSVPADQLKAGERYSKTVPIQHADFRYESNRRASRVHASNYSNQSVVRPRFHELENQSGDVAERLCWKQIGLHRVWESWMLPGTAIAV